MISWRAFERLFSDNKKALETPYRWSESLKADNKIFGNQEG